MGTTSNHTTLSLLPFGVVSVSPLFPVLTTHILLEERVLYATSFFLSRTFSLISFFLLFYSYYSSFSYFSIPTPLFCFHAYRQRNALSSLHYPPNSTFQHFKFITIHLLFLQFHIFLFTNTYNFYLSSL